MVAGFKVITVMPDENGYPDLEAFKAAVSEKTVGCMITNPEDTGIYNPQIDEYVEVLHDAGALAFTDQANANGILGFARARDAGFDACHFNLHKTFSSPHGCEGPATGAYMCTDELAKYLPVPAGDQGRRQVPPRLRPARQHRPRARLPRQLDGRHPRLRLDQQHGPRGPQGGRRDQRPQQQLPRQPAAGREAASAGRTPKAIAGSTRCATACEKLKEETGVGTEDMRDRIVDFGIQSFWMSHHPWVVPEPFTPEPCETYSKDDLDEWAAVDQEVQRRGLRRRRVRARRTAQPADRPDARAPRRWKTRSSGPSPGAPTSSATSARSELVSGSNDKGRPARERRPASSALASWAG